ncbi:hypothetical protein AB0J35_40460 [Nonomuraea angiospora]|uniref:hypothetical protein n=1 Tax=Nonomuraea angiospora TaxID=46172 RepID=UPI0034206C8B
MSKLREVVSEGWKKLPRDHGRLSALHASYTYLHQFTPQVLAAIDFKGGGGGHLEAAQPERRPQGAR